MYHIRASILLCGITFVFNFVRADYLTIKEERSYADPPLETGLRMESLLRWIRK